MNANSWLGLAIVLCHRGQSVWILANGEIKKEASCKVKLYELLDRENNKEKEVTEKIMQEDGLKDIDKETISKKKKLKDARIEETLTENVDVHYLNVVNHVSLIKQLFIQ